MNSPLRLIVGREYLTGYYGCNTGTGSATKLTLECGHIEYRKASKVASGQRYARCRECMTEKACGTNGKRSQG